jgi:ABC-2 type transport system permease protein
MNHAAAVLWAQWRTLRNSYPRGGVAWTAVVGAIWYGFWTLAAIATARLLSNPGNVGLMKSLLPGVLLIVFLYWQVVPLLMAATGSSLELRKLKVYPIPASQLFGIEVMLRTTAGIEMVLILLGIAIGVLFNPELPKWCALAVAPFMLFNLFLAVGLRDLLLRILARKRIREIAFLLLVMCAALPQLLLTRNSAADARIRAVFSGEPWFGWPWAAASNLIRGVDFLHSSAILFAWMLAAAVFGRWQFSHTLTFDAEAAAATDTRPTARQGLLERFYRLPSALLADPLAALIEKEIRFLMRSPRFRLVFLMGFTFGLVVWLPMALGHNAAPRSFLGSNYLTVVSVYSLLLLSEVCFWNSFGFDRSAAQIYFLAPVPFSSVLIGKNLSALFFIALEISAVTTVCAFLGMPLDLQRLAEAYSVAGVISIFLMGAGNLLSIHQARAVNPATSFRSGAAGRVQAMLFLIYPIAFLPAGLAYLARMAFATQLAFFGVLAFDAIVGLIFYKIALDSAVQAAERLKETMITALSAGEGPITG